MDGFEQLILMLCLCEPVQLIYCCDQPKKKKSKIELEEKFILFMDYHYGIK